MKTPFKQHPLTHAIGSVLVMGSALITGCSDSSDSVVILPPATGTYTINTSGGTGGDTGVGGDGEYVDIYLDGGTGGIKVMKSGKTHTAFTSQMGKVTPYLGTTPLIISSDTTIPAITATAVADAGAVTANAYYMGIDGNAYKDDGNGTADYATEALPGGTAYMKKDNIPWSVYLADGGDAAADETVTGIQVNSGATLTLSLNEGDTPSACISLTNDVVNKGIITTTDDKSNNRGNLFLYPANYLGSGVINTAGTTPGQHGGFVAIVVDYNLINTGAITTSGADNAEGAGGTAGDIVLHSKSYLENSAALTTIGGDGTGDSGGDGGLVMLYSLYGTINNSGSLTTAGGIGTMGGKGGDALLLGIVSSKVRNSGGIITSGGHGSSSDGGDAGTIILYGHGPLLVNSGNISATGGNAADGSTAGNGGALALSTENGSASWSTGTTPTGNIELSGNIDLRGGIAPGAGAGTGGSGGSIDIWTNNYGNGNENTASTQKITLLGYKSIDTHGGDGQTPGNGGDVTLNADYGWDTATSSYASGPVTNEAGITTSGGNLTIGATGNSTGASGGDITLETAYFYAHNNPNTKTINRGNLALNGGTGRNNADSLRNRGGEVWVWGYHGLTNSGAITANGGDDLSSDGDTSGAGGASGDIQLYAEMGPVVSSGNLTANGGNGEYAGGPAHMWTMLIGPSVKATGAILGKGGDADTSLANSMGGYGGEVWLLGSDGPTSVKHGTITMTPGTGNLANTWWDGSSPDTGAGYQMVIGGHCSGDC